MRKNDVIIMRQLTRIVRVAAESNRDLILTDNTEAGYRVPVLLTTLNLFNTFNGKVAGGERNGGKRHRPHLCRSLCLFPVKMS